MYSFIILRLLFVSNLSKSVQFNLIIWANVLRKPINSEGSANMRLMSDYYQVLLKGWNGSLRTSQQQQSEAGVVNRDYSCQRGVRLTSTE